MQTILCAKYPIEILNSFVKLLNGKGASTIPAVNHDGKELVRDEQKAEALNHFFHSCFNTAVNDV